MMKNTRKTLPRGMTAFTIIWITQIVSVLSSAMSQFGLTIWMYQQTKSATTMGLMQVFFITPFLILSPVAGVMVDRYNRKLMMAVSDVAAFFATGMILVLITLGRLEFWHLYVAAALNGIGNTFQWPAYSAAITTMIPKEQLGRVNGLMSLMEAGPGVFAPLLAGSLLPLIGLSGILLFDVATFILAVSALLFVFIPQPVRTVEGEAARGDMLKEASYGFKYIFSRPSLLGLQLVFFFGNLFTGIANTVTAPMILAHTNSNSLIYGSVQTAGAAGGIIGGIAMSAWGGTKRKVHGVLTGWILTSFFGLILFGMSREVIGWSIFMAIAYLFSPWVNASNQAIWQAKVAPDLQGRVFSARRLIAWFSNPISPIIGGVLSDYVLEPAMRTSASPLAKVFNPFVGTGAGSGMSLLFLLCGVLALGVGVTGYFVPAIRNAETILPDYDQIEKAKDEPQSAAAA
jgi:MFS family permease